MDPEPRDVHSESARCLLELSACLYFLRWSRYAMPAAIKKVAPHKGMLDSSDTRSSFKAPTMLPCERVTIHHTWSGAQPIGRSALPTLIVSNFHFQDGQWMQHALFFRDFPHYFAGAWLKRSHQRGLQQCRRGPQRC